MELDYRPGFIQKIRDWVRILMSSVYTGKGTPSTTKIVYITAGLWGTYAALLMTFALAGVYVFTGHCDTAFATAMGSLWIGVWGFATSAQKHKAEQDKRHETTNEPS